jgi:rubrerythrin
MLQREVTKVNTQTKKNLLAAMHGEAFAHAKYLLFAEAARQSGDVALAELFERTARVELTEHFREEAELAGLVGTNAENLRDAIDGEGYEVETMYREYAERAEAAGEGAAADRFQEIRSDEAGHLAAFEAALARVEPTKARSTTGR